MIFIDFYFMIVDLTIGQKKKREREKGKKTAQFVHDTTTAEIAEFNGDTKSLGAVSHLYVQIKASVMLLL